MNFINFNKYKYKGGIDSIELHSIKGWIFSQNKIFNEVHIYCGKNLLVSCKINKRRKDIIKLFNTNQDCGFEIELKNNILKRLKNEKISVKVVDFDKLIKKNIYLISGRNKTQRILNEALRSQFLGSSGNIDGLMNDGLIHGWAKRNSHKKYLNIWVHCEKKSARILTEYKKRKDLPSKGIKDTSGFTINPNQLSNRFFNEELWFSFDRKGIFKLRQENKLILNQYKLEQTQSNNFLSIEKINEKLSMNNSDNSEFNKDKNIMSHDIKEIEKNLINFKLLLNKFENKIIKDKTKINFLIRFYRKFVLFKK